ncbi:MAG: hypothetical protein V7L17_32170 [Nostoc sp.]
MIEISLWMGNDRVIFWLYLGIALICDTVSVVLASIRILTGEQATRSVSQRAS